MNEPLVYRVVGIFSTQIFNNYNDVIGGGRGSG